MLIFAGGISHRKATDLCTAIIKTHVVFPFLVMVLFWHIFAGIITLSQLLWRVLSQSGQINCIKQVGVVVQMYCICHSFVFISFVCRSHLLALDLKSVTWKCLNQSSITAIMMWWSGCDTFPRVDSMRPGPSPAILKHQLDSRFRNFFLFLNLTGKAQYCVVSK